MTLTEVLHIIDTLSADELNQLEARIQERKENLQHEPKQDIETWQQQLKQGLADFREGLSEEELAEIIQDMNAEYTNPADLKTFDWLDEETNHEENTQ